MSALNEDLLLKALLMLVTPDTSQYCITPKSDDAPYVVHSPVVAVVTDSARQLLTASLKVLSSKATRQELGGPSSPQDEYFALNAVAPENMSVVSKLVLSLLQFPTNPAKYAAPLNISRMSVTEETSQFSSHC